MLLNLHRNCNYFSELNKCCLNRFFLIDCWQATSVQNCFWQHWWSRRLDAWFGLTPGVDLVWWKAGHRIPFLICPVYLGNKVFIEAYVLRRSDDSRGRYNLASHQSFCHTLGSASAADELGQFGFVWPGRTSSFRRKLWKIHAAVL